MAIPREPNYLFLTIGLVCAMILATAAGTQVSLAFAGVLVGASTFMLTAWFVLESRRQFVLVGALALTALSPFVWLVRQPEEQFLYWVERLYLLNITIWLLSPLLRS